MSSRVKFLLPTLMRHKQPARFITLEGIEGVGKTTQLKFLTSYFQEKGIPLMVTHEPGGTWVAESLRKLVLQTSEKGEKLLPEAELLLFFAARAQHIHHVIKPALQNGYWVLSDRFTESSYAYQGGGRGIDFSFIRNLQCGVQKDVEVDAVLLLDASVVVALNRTRSRNQLDRIESEERNFFDRVRATYLDRAAKKPGLYHIIDASQSLAMVQAQIKHVLECLLSNWNKNQ